MNEHIASYLAEAQSLLQVSRYNDALCLLNKLKALLGSTTEPICVAACEFLLGTALLGLSRAVDSIDAFERAKSAFSRIGMAQHAASCEGSIANALRALSRWQEAIEHYSLALTEFQRLGLPYEAALSTMNVGVTLRDLGQSREAIEHFERAISEFRQGGHEDNVAMCLENIGSAKRDLGRYQEAIDFLEQARELYLHLGMEKDAADCDDGIGIALHEAGFAKDALARFSRALTVYIGLKLSRNAADCQVNAGNSLRTLSRYDEALTAFHNAVRVFESLNLKRQIADCELDIANVHVELGRPEDAVPLFSRARDVYEALANPKLVALAENNMSCCFHAMGQYEQALASCRSSRARYRALGMEKDAAGCDLNLGKTLTLLGRVEEALDAFESARVVYRELSLRDELAHCELMTGNAVMGYGDARTGCTHFAEAARLYRASGSYRNAADCDANLGVALLILKQYERAREHMTSALSFFSGLGLPKDKAQCETNLSFCLSAEGRFDEALSCIALALDNPGAQPFTKETADRFMAAGIAHRGLRQPAAAIAFQERAKQIYVSFGLEREAATCENNISLAFYDAGRFEDALDRSRAAIEVLETLRENIAAMNIRAGFGEMNRGPWEIATQASLELGQAFDSMVYLERSRARTLAECLAMNLECDPSEIDRQAYEEYCNARHTLTECGLAFPSTPGTPRTTGKPREPQRVMRRIIDDILERFPNTKLARGLRASAVTYLEREEEYMALLPDARSCILDFLAWPDRNGCFRAYLLTRKNGLELIEFREGSLAALARANDRWKQIYESRTTIATAAELVTDICFQLDELIFSAPVRIAASTGAVKRCRLLDHLDETLAEGSELAPRSLCIIPHRFLFLMPLHAAARHEQGRIRYLLEDFVVSYAPSAYLLHYARHRERLAQKALHALVVGNPMPSPRPLNGAAVEARLVARQLRSLGWTVEELTDVAATRKAFLHGSALDENKGVAGIYSGTYSHIHLAQHALIQDNGHAALIFAERQNAAERECSEADILKASLSHVDAVVAATCVSSVTDPDTDDYLGLGAAFLRAGVRTFLGTLYPLSDIGSQRLIPEIYRLRFIEGLSWAQSLRAAQLEMLRHSGGHSENDNDALAQDRGVSSGVRLTQNVPSPEHPYHWASFAATGL